MIFRGIKRKTHQFFFNNKLPEFIGKLGVVESKKINKILVLLDDMTLKDSIEADLKKRMQVDEFYIHTLIFDSNLKSDGTFNDWFNPDDFGWFGKLKSGRLRTILTNRYDLLINYSKVDNIYINLLILHSDSGFYAGFPHVDHGYFNLLIDCKTGDWKTFNAELQKYLLILDKVKK